MIFSKQLGKVGGRTAQDDIRYIANHIRRMQEELEYRLMNLDSENINEIDAGVTKIYSDGVELLTLIGSDENYSAIKQTVDDILLTVQDIETGMGQTLRLAEDGITIVNAQGSALLINGGQIDAETLNVDFADISGTLKANRIKLYGSMAVYKSSTSTASGGELGYTTSSLDGSLGMHMISENGQSEVVVTDNGAKMMYLGTANQMYVAEGAAGISVGGTEYLHIYGNTDTVLLRGGTWDFTEVGTVDFTDVTVLGLTAAATTAVFA